MTSVMRTYWERATLPQKRMLLVLNGLPAHLATVSDYDSLPNDIRQVLENTAAHSKEKKLLMKRGNVEVYQQNGKLVVSSPEGEETYVSDERLNELFKRYAYLHF